MNDINIESKTDFGPDTPKLSERTIEQKGIEIRPGEITTSLSIAKTQLLSNQGKIPAS